MSPGFNGQSPAIFPNSPHIRNSIGIQKGHKGGGYINTQPIRRFLLPRAMHKFHIYQSPHILVELAHQEVDIEQVIELPALADHGVTKKIAQSDSVDIVTG